MTTASVEAPAFDPAKLEAFGGTMIGVLNGAVLSFMVSIGHETGLYDTMSGLPPSTSSQVAAAAGLNERYVREWLGAMVTGGIIEYQPADATYRLPAEHAAMLTTAAGPDNMAFFCQYMKLFASVESRVTDCFRNGGGVPYSAFGDFQRLQRLETAAIYDASLIQRTIPAVPGIADRLIAGIDVADFGCGGGHALNVMAREFPASRFTGLDISDEGLAFGRAEAQAWGLSNVTFVARDVAAPEPLPLFDFITAFDTIHDQVAPRAVLANIRRALRPGGTFLMVDIAASSLLEENIPNPMAPMLYGISTLHCMTVSLAHGGEGLGTVWGDQTARAYLSEAGFGDVDTFQVEGDMFNAYYVARA